MAIKPKTDSAAAAGQGATTFSTGRDAHLDTRARLAALIFAAGVTAEPAVGIGAKWGANAAAARRSDWASSMGVGVVQHGIAIRGAIADVAGATIRADPSLRIAALPVRAAPRRGVANGGRVAHHTGAGVWRGSVCRRGGGGGHAGPILADLPDVLARVADVVGPADQTGQTAVGVTAAPTGVADPIAHPGARRAAELFPVTDAEAAGVVTTLGLAIRAAIWTALGVAGGQQQSAPQGT
jgi:hypothetical protein